MIGIRSFKHACENLLWFLWTQIYLHVDDLQVLANALRENPDRFLHRYNQTSENAGVGLAYSIGHLHTSAKISE